MKILSNFFSKNIGNRNKNCNLKKIYGFLDSEKYSRENLKSLLLEINKEYKYYFDTSYKKDFPLLYENFLKNRIENNDNKIDLLALMISDNTNYYYFNKNLTHFIELYKKNRLDLLDDTIIKLSIKLYNVDFVLEINDQKENDYNFIGSNLYLSWIENNFKKYKKINRNQSDIFLDNVSKNIDNEKSKMILSKYNIKLNSKYNELVLKNLIYYKNEELIKKYINTPVFSFKKLYKSIF